MEKELAIYLAGNIQKGHEKESAIFWAQDDMEVIREKIAPMGITFLNPATRTDDLSDQKSVFGRDMTQVYFGDAIFVDARERRGLGVGAEMMWAKMNRLPVLTLVPKNSHYRRKEVNLLGVHVDNWVHPFIESLSDAIVENVEEGALWLKELASGNVKVKGPEFIHEAMRYYQEEQLSHDLPMKELIEENSRLKEKMLESSRG
ncbi:MAG: hypothetical protein P0S96_07235 [Simkaniaceae bacterium]|nr:hypothetical protein [Candidatus Sacchlamyda saccharinae]